MDILRVWLAAVVAAFVVCGWGGVAQGQCERGWEGLGAYPGTREEARVISWDPDGAGPEPEALVATGYGAAGSETREGACVWDGNRWSLLGSAGIRRVAAHRDGALYGYRDGSVSSRGLYRWDPAAGDWALIADLAPVFSQAIAVNEDGDVVLGGTFRDFHGYDYIVRWDPDTGDYAPAGAFNGSIAAFYRLGTRLYAGGPFTKVDGRDCGGIAMLEAGSENWIPLPSPGVGFGAGDLCEFQGDLLVGTLGASSTEARRYSFATGMWTSFPTSRTARLLPYGFAVLPNGDLLCTGSFQFSPIMLPPAQGPLAIVSASTGECTLVFEHPSIGRRIIPRADGTFAVTGVAGSFEFPWGTPQKQGNGVIGWSPITGETTVYGEGLPAPALGMVPLADGSVLLSGRFSSVGNTFTGGVARWEPRTNTFASAGAERFLWAPCIKRVRSGRTLAAAVVSGNQAGVFEWDERTGEWVQLGDLWSYTFVSQFQAYLTETPDGVLACRTADRLRKLEPGATRWLVAPIYSFGGTGPIGSAVPSRVILSGSPTREWNLEDDTLVTLGVEGPGSTNVLLERSAGDLVAGGAALRRLDPVTNQWAPLAGVDATSVSALAELPGGGLAVESRSRSDASGTNAIGGIAALDGASLRWRHLVQIPDTTPGPTSMAVTASGDLAVSGEFERLYGSNWMWSPRLAVYRNLVPPCLADFDCSRAVDADDTIAFFRAWDAGDARADVDGDGDVDGEDVGAFYGAWDAGC
ncbi:MAG: hypothetical protein ACOYN0_10720 [Phycisphaerales bacterium]